MPIQASRQVDYNLFCQDGSLCFLLTASDLLTVNHCFTNVSRMSADLADWYNYSFGLALMFGWSEWGVAGSDGSDSGYRLIKPADHFVMTSDAAQ